MDHLDLELTAGDADLPLRLAEDGFAVSDGLENGTGPYRIERMDADRHLLLTRVEDHYRQSRAEALRDGFVDVALGPEQSVLQETSGLLRPTEEIVASSAVGVPMDVGSRHGLDDARLAERWWLV